MLTRTDGGATGVLGAALRETDVSADEDGAADHVAEWFENRRAPGGNVCAFGLGGVHPMRYMRLRHVVLAAVLGGLLLVPALADAQSRGRARSAPRSAPRAGRPPAAVAAPSYRPYYYRPYRPGVSLGFYYGSPWFIGPYSYGLGYYYGYPYGYRYGYGYGGYPAYGGAYRGYGTQAYGGVRIAVAQRDAEVYVDGYYAGIVDDFDGSLQRVDLEPGPHHIEVSAEGYEPVSFDVKVEPGQTITYRAALRQSRP